jgi:hypothetical protein
LVVSKERKKERKRKKRTLLGSIEELTILLDTLVNFQDSGTRQNLHDHSGGDNGGDTELHEGSPVRGEDDTEPVKRISILRRENSKERNLTEHQENKQGHSGPHDLLLELNLNERRRKKEEKNRKQTFQ